MLFCVLLPLLAQFKKHFMVVVFFSVWRAWSWLREGVKWRRTPCNSITLIHRQMLANLHDSRPNSKKYRTIYAHSRKEAPDEATKRRPDEITRWKYPRKVPGKLGCCYCEINGKYWFCREPRIRINKSVWMCPFYAGATPRPCLRCMRRLLSEILACGVWKLLQIPMVFPFVPLSCQNRIREAVYCAPNIAVCEYKQSPENHGLRLTPVSVRGRPGESGPLPCMYWAFCVVSAAARFCVECRPPTTHTIFVFTHSYLIWRN